SGADTSSEPAAQSRPPLILLVEDNPTDVFVIRGVLQECGIECQLQVAADGETALAFLRGLEADADADAHAACPALVLLDLNLPKISGIEVLAPIRQGPALWRCAPSKNKEIPVTHEPDFL
ncbi:MAG TPA: response regulator, partial [Bryobacteraceae bacterium]